MKTALVFLIAGVISGVVSVLSLEGEFGDFLEYVLNLGEPIFYLPGVIFGVSFPTAVELANVGRRFRWWKWLVFILFSSLLYAGAVILTIISIDTTTLTFSSGISGLLGALGLVVLLRILMGPLSWRYAIITVISGAVVGAMMQVIGIDELHQAIMFFTLWQGVVAMSLGLSLSQKKAVVEVTQAGPAA